MTGPSTSQSRWRRCELTSFRSVHLQRCSTIVLVTSGGTAYLCCGGQRTDRRRLSASAGPLLSGPASGPRQHGFDGTQKPRTHSLLKADDTPPSGSPTCEAAKAAAPTATDLCKPARCRGRHRPAPRRPGQHDVGPQLPWVIERQPGEVSARRVRRPHVDLTCLTGYRDRRRRERYRVANSSHLM